MPNYPRFFTRGSNHHLTKLQYMYEPMQTDVLYSTYECVRARSHESVVPLLQVNGLAAQSSL